jgi:hypothetical protein
MADPRQTCHLLRLGSERRGQEAAGQRRDEHPPVDHSMT